MLSLPKFLTHTEGISEKKIVYSCEYLALKRLSSSVEFVLTGFRQPLNVWTELNLGPWMFPRITSGGTTERQEHSIINKSTTSMRIFLLCQQ